MYSLERDLVRNFIAILPASLFSQKGQAIYQTEFNYSRGGTDIILLDGNNELVAFEAKLKKWREALHQAYRNTSFAQYSYILVPEQVAEIAAKYLAEFSRRSAGICFISGNEIKISYRAHQNVPLQEYLYERAKQSLLKGDHIVSKLH